MFLEAEPADYLAFVFPHVSQLALQVGVVLSEVLHRRKHIVNFVVFLDFLGIAGKSFMLVNKALFIFSHHHTVISFVVEFETIFLHLTPVKSK